MVEPFSQWVLRDRFAAGRPPWEDADVQLVDDVEPYELMKLRLLDGEPLRLLGYLGHLGGHDYVHEVIADPKYAAMTELYMVREASPTSPPLTGIDLPG